ncbi:MAG TPA: carbohydrate porin [Stellaceae bacterium]|nr:carbohydrate porin [Stellaceae bacterium]
MTYLPIRSLRALAVAAGLAVPPLAGAFADEPAEAPPAAAEPKLLLGDLGGLRPKLAAQGIDLGITYIGEAFGNVTGGVRRGAVYEGQLGVSLDADLGKLVGWPGAKAHVNAIEIHGSGPSADLLGGNLMTVSNIEARPTLRLYALWLEQNFADDRLSVRIGQLAADAEFITSNTAGGLINGTFGWPLLTAADTRGGGPAYPLPQPGVRLQAKSAEDVTVRAALFSAQPGGRGCTGNPQVCDPHGVAFSLSGGTLWLAEAEYDANAGKNAAGLPGAYKLGGWRETGAFADQLSGALDRSGDWGVYGIVDQMIWRRAGTEDQGVSVFVRLGGAPSDRNLVSFYADGGIGFKAPFAERPGDVLTLGAAYGRISGDAALADRLAGPPTPVRDHEALIELSYAAAIKPGWTLQPDLQYVIHPGGNVLAPNGGGVIGNALIFGLRTSLAF